MKAAPFGYERVDSLTSAVEALTQWGPSARILAGGQSLLPLMALRQIAPSAVIDVSGVADGGVEADAEVVSIGAAVTQTVAGGLGVPLLDAALPHVGHRQTRNRGTVCGSLAHADPLGELPLALLVLGADVDILGPAGRRRVSVDGLLERAFSPRVGADEVVGAVRCQRTADRPGVGFVEVSRAGQTIAAAAAVAERVGGARTLRFGVAGPVDRPHAATVDAHVSADNGPELAHELIDDLDMIGDRNGDPTYRRALCLELAARAIAAACRDRDGSDS